MKYGEFGHSWCERKYRVVVIDRDGVTLEPLAKTRMIGCACACSLTCRFADRVSYAAGLCRWAVSKARAEVQDPRALQRKRDKQNVHGNPCWLNHGPRLIAKGSGPEP